MTNPIRRHLRVALSMFAAALLGLMLMYTADPTRKGFGMILGFAIVVISVVAGTVILVSGFWSTTIARRRSQPISPAEPSLPVNLIDGAFASWMIAAFGGILGFSGMRLGWLAVQVRGFVLVAAGVGLGGIAVIAGTIWVVRHGFKRPWS
jgi:hypothetical protein